MIGNGRALAWWRSLLVPYSGGPVATVDGVGVVPATDAAGILWTRSADSFVPPIAAGAAGSPLTVFDTPAAATAPDADTPAVAGLANAIETLVVTVNAVAAQPVLTLVIRDGATGAGAILWSIFLGPVVIGSNQTFVITGLNIVGTVNTEMTVETTAAPAATNFVSIAWTGRLTTV